MEGSRICPRGRALQGVRLCQRSAIWPFLFSLMALATGTSFSITSRAAADWSNIADAVFQHPVSDTVPPSPPILAIAQDKAGFLWVGTEQGLVRWDGYHYRMYRADRSNPRALADNYIQRLHVDSQGTLWIATASGGLSRYDPRGDSFVNYSAATAGLSDDVVTAIADDGDAGVWVATEHGLDDVTAERGVIDHMHHEDNDPASLPSSNGTTVFHDSKGRLWIGTVGAVIRQDVPKGPFVKVFLPAHEGVSSAAACVAEGSDGTIWVGTTLGAYIIHPDSPGVNPEAVPGTQSNQILSIAESRRGEMWLGTYGNGVLVVDEASFAIRHIVNDPFLRQDLDEDTLWAIFRDSAGGMWVGTNRGLSRHDPNQSAILTVFGAVSRPRGISDGDVEAVMQAPNGQLWLGLGARGINILDPLAGRVAEMRTAIDTKGKSRQIGEVTDLLATDKGDVFFCTRSGLYRKRSADRRAVQIAVPGDVSIRTAVVMSETGNLWLGSMRDGLFTLGLREGGHVEAWVGSNELIDRRITALQKDSSGGLWVGTMNGLNHIDPVSRSVEHIGSSTHDPHALSAPNVGTLMMDRDGHLWVGTEGGGISILEGRGTDGRPYFRYLGLTEGLPNLNVDKLLQTATGEVWVATDDGLAIIDAQRFSIRALRSADGLAITSYWLNAGAVTNDGTVVLGGAGGLTLVRPVQLSQDKYQHAVAVSEVRVAGKPVPWSPQNDPSGLPIEITPKGNSFAVEFSALDYAAPERTRYEYQLENYDHAWIDTDSSHRVAAYTNLPPGGYLLRIRSSNAAGEWGATALSVPVHVQAAWYQTIWLKLAALMVVLGAVRVLLQTRTAYLRRRQRDLEEQVAIQTAKLRDREQQLEQLAYLDPLTGLANRRMLTRRFDSILARPNAEKMGALLLIDLDRFKAINDTHGHDAGDALLVAIARRLRTVVRNADDVFRLGGDEFAILIADSPDDASVEAVCRRIVAEVSAVVPFNGLQMESSPSIGVAKFSGDCQSLQALLKAADLAMYAAKHAGRNTWRWGHVENSA